MHPMGRKEWKVPKKPPIKDTRPLKMGIPLAIMYTTIETGKVEHSQVIQCIAKLNVR